MVHLAGRLRLKTLGIFSCLLLGGSLFFPDLDFAQEKRVLAVLPFRISTPTPMDQLGKQLQEMFTTRIGQEGFPVVSPADVNRHPRAAQPRLDPQEILGIGKELKADLVISGSLTQVGKRISLDLKIFDTKGEKPPFSIFVVEDDMDRLSDGVDKALRSLFNQIAGVEQIDSVLVTGNQRIETEAILAVTESKKGERLDYDKLDRDLRAIYRMGFFKDVKIQTEDGPKGKIVTFDVAEKQSIGTITFRGNKKIKSDDLNKELGIKPYSILNFSEVRQSINRLRDFYRQKGYYNVEIKDKIEELPRNEVALIYEISEGEKVYIRRIEFVGNAKVRTKDLKGVMDTTEKGLFSIFTDSGILDKKKLEFDVQKITVYYQNHGFLKAKIGEPKITYEQGEGLIITIDVVEGDQYTVHDVTVTGDLLLPPEDLLKLTKIKKQKFFSRDVVREDVIALKEAYTNEGYAYAEVAPSIKEDDPNHWVDLAYNISQGKKVRLERINIAGNTSTRDKVIRRELELYEGEFFSGEGLKISTMNLNRLGYFEDVDIQMKQGSQDDLMNLNINLKEKPTGSFSIGAGYGGYEGAFGTLQVSQNNLFGRGQRLVGALRIGGKTQEIDLRFTEPWLFDKRLSLSVDLLKWKFQYPEYLQDSYGGSVKLGYPLGIDRWTIGSVRYFYQNAFVSDIEPGAAPSIQELAGTTITSSMLFAIERDSKDRQWNPSKGSINSASFEYAGGPLGGDVYFNRYEARSTWFFPLPWATVFMAQGRIGLVEQREGGVLPDYQKYHLGGMNTLRGYDYWSVSPIDPVTGTLIGGEKMLLFNFEYRFPLLEAQGVVGVVFLDAGNAWTKSESYSLSDLRKSVGAGIRWYSPFGPIRVEYGYILDPRPGDPTGNVEFSIGGFF